MQPKGKPGEMLEEPTVLYDILFVICLDSEFRADHQLTTMEFSTERRQAVFKWIKARISALLDGGMEEVGSQCCVGCSVASLILQGFTPKSYS